MRIRRSMVALVALSLAAACGYDPKLKNGGGGPDGGGGSNRDGAITTGSEAGAVEAGGVGEAGGGVGIDGGRTGGIDVASATSGVEAGGEAAGPYDGAPDKPEDVPVLVIDGGKDVNTGGSGGAGGAGGVVGTGGIGGAGGVGKNAPIASGGAGGGGGIASTADAPEAGGATGGAPSSGGIPSVGGATGGSTVGSGGATSTGGTTSSGGVTSTGGASSTGGVTSTGGATGNGGVTGTGGSTVATCSPACNPDENCISSTCTLRWGGMTCSTQQDCPSWATCCDGSNESCDGTRLPSGDGTNPGEFVVSGDGLTVTDTITGLVWQRDGSGTRTACSGPGALTCSWSEAQAYCASLVLGGLSGWRLPAVLELSTIVDFTQTSPPTIDQATFPGTPSEYFWATSPPSGGYGHPYIDFGSGEWNNYYSLFYRARCVH